MPLKKELAAARVAWAPLTLYQKFEHLVILVLTGLIVLIILDLSSTDALQLFALAAAILALGGVYWLVRDQDRRHHAALPPAPKSSAQ